MSGAVDGELAWQSLVLLVAAVAVPPLAVVWHGMSGATASGPLLLGASVVPLGALALGLGRIAVYVEDSSDRPPSDRARGATGRPPGGRRSGDVGVETTDD